ncbi:MAG: DUF5106 domain-containing protein [Bacteroidetes bacterium]|nr:DUF5106 domain-containing protein [Bacteroidota bacterium]
MNKKQAIRFIFLLLIFNIQGKAQVNFRIILDNYSDSSVLLTSYYGNKIKPVDTAFLNEGVFNFKNNNYPAGIYILAGSSKNKLFEFIINEETNFTIHTDASSWHEFEVEGSKENELFLTHLQLRNRLYLKAMQLNEAISEDASSDGKVAEIESQLDSLKKVLEDEETQIVTDHPDLFFSKILEARTELQVPDSIVNDSIQKYLYYKTHFWDKMDLSDARFLRTPVIDQKLQSYFDQIVFLHPDSTIAAIDSLIALARPSDEVVSYLLWYFIAKYQNPQYMGFDAVFVHLVDNYFSKEEVFNTTSSINEKLKERSDKLKPLLIGAPAPDLLLMDTNDRFVSFRNLDADYILLLFWDFNCDVCETEIAELQELIDTISYKISIYAINTNSNLARWKKEINARNMDWINVNGTYSITNDFHELYDISGTPRMFLLNHEKKIMAKHFKVAQLIPIIEKQFMKSK